MREDKKIAEGLPYRDFVTVGLLVNKLNLKIRPERKLLEISFLTVGYMFRIRSKAWKNSDIQQLVSVSGQGSRKYGMDRS